MAVWRSSCSDTARARRLGQEVSAWAVAGQTIEDVAFAEAAFLERVIELHPDAEGKPTVIGNWVTGVPEGAKFM